MTDNALIPQRSLRELVPQILACRDVPSLTRLAEKCGGTGAALLAVSQLAVWRVKCLFAEIEEQYSPEEIESRLFGLLAEEMGEQKAHQVIGALGATGRRATLATKLYGYPSFYAWVQAETEGLPYSVPTACQKAVDIEMWIRAGASHETVLFLLAQTPMAGRKFQQNALLPDGTVKEEYREVVGENVDEFLKELSALPPAQANKRVSEVLGEPQIYAVAGLYRGGKLALTVRYEKEDLTEQYDLLVISSDRREFKEVANWLMNKLHVRER
ncbi:MAG: hypothetical protein OCU12_05970 [Methanophagales archaeon]|nr:hypothetical protein [Methanophagales archaeon]